MPTKRSESRNTRQGRRFPQQAGGQEPPTSGPQKWRPEGTSRGNRLSHSLTCQRPKATTHAPHSRPRGVGGGALTRLRRCSPGFREVPARWDRRPVSLNSGGVEACWLPVRSEGSGLGVSGAAREREESLRSLPAATTRHVRRGLGPGGGRGAVPGGR